MDPTVKVNTASQDPTIYIFLNQDTVIDLGQQIKDVQLFKEALTFRQYDSTITKSLAEEPTDAGTFFDEDAVRNHKSTKFCSCRVGTTG